jgi:hypothetical protein
MVYNKQRFLTQKLAIGGKTLSFKYHTTIGVIMIKVKNASYYQDYKITVEFDSGEYGIVDLENALWGPVFEPLKDVELFKKFKVSETFHTIFWENGADIAPESLYDRLKKVLTTETQKMQ